MSKRVQWAQRTTGDALDHDHGDRAGSHELDEQGLDRTAFSTLRDALTAHAEENLPSHSHAHAHEPASPQTPDTERELTEDHPSQPMPIDLPGIFVDPNESAGLPGGVRRPDTTDTTTHSVQDQSHDLPLPSASAPATKRRSLANIFRRSKRTSTHLRPPQPSPPGHSTTRRRNGLSKGPSVLSALLSLHDMEDHSLPPTPGDRSRSSSISTTITPPSSRPLSWSRATGASARPPTQRNAAGVFGALVATTGNISGAAAPTSSTLQPDIKRKGYKVSRYAGTVPSSPTATGPSSPRAPPPGKISLPPIRIDDSHGTSTTVQSARQSPDSQHEIKSDAGLLSSMSAPTTPSGIRRHFPYSIDLPTPRFPGLRKRGTEGPESPHSFAESDGGYFIPQPASLLSGPLSEKSEIPDITPVGKDARTSTSTSQEKKRKTRRTKAQVFITRHVAAIRARHTFLLRLARAMMMFGAPTHRLPSQLQATARVLDVALSVVYLPDVMILAFDDPDTATSSVQLVRQGSSLDLSKLQDAYKVYWAVIHDETSVEAASSALDALMVRPPLYSYW